MWRQYKKQLGFILSAVLIIVNLAVADIPASATTTGPGGGGGTASATAVDLIQQGTDLANGTDGLGGPTSDANKLPMVTCSGSMSNVTAGSGVLGGNFLSSIGVNLDTLKNNFDTPQLYSNTVIDPQHDLSGDDLKYLYNEFKNNQSMAVIQFGASTDNPVRGSSMPANDTQCKKFVMVPVSDTEWRGYQDYYGGEYPATDHFLRFVADSPGSQTGNLTYEYRMQIPNRPTYTAQYVTDSVALGGSASSGGGGGSVSAGTVPIVWRDASEIAIGGGSPYNGEVYRKLSWDNANYYFLTDVSGASQDDQNARGGMVYGQGRLDCNPYPGQNTNSGDCKIVQDLSKSCVPFFYVSNEDFSFRQSYIDNKDTSGLQNAINKLGTKESDVRYYNYNSDCSSIGGSSGAAVSNLATPSANTWFYYSAKNDQFITVFSDGAGNESSYIGLYKKVGALYKGPDTACAGQITASPQSGAFWATWHFFDKTCQTEYGSVKVWVIAREDLFTAQQTAATTTSDQGGGTDAKQTDYDKCVNSDFFGWILCSIYNLVGHASDWIFAHIVQPLLKVQPIDLDTSSRQYKIWSGFRIYGDIFLIIALLIIVFGEAAGGGLIDAYTAKKILPRLLAAAILINLSIYIAAFLVDVGNILGGGIGELITRPLGSAAADQAFSIHLSGIQVTKIYAGGVSALLLGYVFKTALADAAIGFLLSIGGMIFFGFLAMALTLIVRAAAINILLLISPVAFALYCLPNTEKYFRKWWDVLLELIIIYPFIVVFIAAGKLLAVTLNFGSDSGIKALMSFVLQFLPLLFIPFAFRLASKTLGRLNEGMHGLAMKGHEKTSKGWAAQYQANAGKKVLQRRAEMYHGLNASAQQEGRTRLGGMTRRFGARVIGGYNVEGAMSATRAAEGKEINDQIATGRDEEIRGLTVNKKRALAGPKAIWNSSLNDGRGGWADAQGNALSDAELANYGYGERDGKRMFQTLGGAWVDESSVDQGQKRWKNNTFAQQAALSYEMRKANTDGNRARLANEFHSVASGDGGWGMSKGVADGAWIGAAFENQNNNLQFKYTKRDAQGNTSFDHAGFVQEVYEKRGSYAMSNMDATTIDRLTEAAQSGAVPQEQLQAIALTMQDRMAGARDSRGTVQPTGAEGAAEASGGAAPLGAGHVYEAMNRFVGTVLPPSQRRGPQPPDMPPHDPFAT